MSDDDRRTLEAILERGFDRMDARFDALAAEIRAHGTEIALLKQGCAMRAVENERRDKRISALARAVGAVDKEVSQVTAAPKLETTAVDVVRLLDEREEQRARRVRQWMIWGAPVVLALLGAPQIRSCIGEERAERLEQAVRRLEAKVEQSQIVRAPASAPAPAPAKGGTK